MKTLFLMNIDNIYRANMCALDDAVLALNIFRDYFMKIVNSFK